MKTSMRRGRRRGLGVIAAVASLAIYTALVALPAGAAVACDFAAGTASVTLADAGDAVTVSRGRPLEARSRPTAAGPTPCGTATNTTTETIEVDAVAAGDVEDQSLTIVLSAAGASGPGYDEPGETDEIEFTVDLGAGDGHGHGHRHPTSATPSSWVPAASTSTQRMATTTST